MPVVAFPEFFGGSPGPENDCGWYCELARARRLGCWAYVVQFIAVALLVSFWANINASKADQISQAEERCQSIGLQRATSNGSELYFDLPAMSNRLKA